MPARTQLAQTFSPLPVRYRVCWLDCTLKQIQLDLNKVKSHLIKYKGLCVSIFNSHIHSNIEWLLSSKYDTSDCCYHYRGFKSLNQQFSEYDPTPTSSNSLIGEYTRNENSQAAPRSTESETLGVEPRNPCLNKCLMCSGALKFENTCSRTVALHFGCSLESPGTLFQNSNSWVPPLTNWITTSGGKTQALGDFKSSPVTSVERPRLRVIDLNIHSQYSRGL